MKNLNQEEFLIYATNSLREYSEIFEQNWQLGPSFSEHIWGFARETCLVPSKSVIRIIPFVDTRAK